MTPGQLPNKVLRATTFILLILCSGLIQADGHARLPYPIVYRQLSVLDELGHLDKVQARMLIRSTSAEVKPDSIELFLNELNRVHRFPVDPQGLVDFPLRDDWRSAGYLVESNQPAGTLKLDTFFGIKRLKATQLPYRLLMDCALQIQEALMLQARLTGQDAPRVVGLIFNFAADETADISIAAGSGEQIYSSAGNNVIRLEIDEELMAGNPIVSFERLPLNIQPWLN